MGADAHMPQKYDEHRHPTNGRPRGDLSAVFISMILKKNCLVQRGPKRGSRATPSGIGHIISEI